MTSPSISAQCSRVQLPNSSTIKYYYQPAAECTHFELTSFVDSGFNQPGRARLRAHITRPLTEWISRFDLATAVVIRWGLVMRRHVIPKVLGWNWSLNHKHANASGAEILKQKIFVSPAGSADWQRCVHTTSKGPIIIYYNKYYVWHCMSRMYVIVYPNC